MMEYKDRSYCFSGMATITNKEADTNQWEHDVGTLKTMVSIVAKNNKWTIIAQPFLSDSVD